MGKDAPEANQLDCRRTYVHIVIYIHTRRRRRRRRFIAPRKVVYVYATKLPNIGRPETRGSDSVSCPAVRIYG